MDESGGFIGPLIMLAILIIWIAGAWKSFSKAGEPGWSCIIPIYNYIIFLKIAGRPWWWLILLFIPIVSIIIYFIICIDFSKSFSKGVGFGIGLALLPYIFFPILGFGSASYDSPSAAQ